ncbi:MAG: UDP-glucose 4-epimerase GalE [Bacilli bacterium]|jgi:UDP-glucose 4-epimerase|nr:UDP-glucose 4-epimerase GalE [Bacilli bacterium]
MNILIIGGAGYIGSHQVKMMLDYHNNVIVLDNLNTGYQEMVDHKAKFIKGDIRDYDLVCSILKNENIDVVMHFAALSLVGVSMSQPSEYYDNNVVGMLNLLNCMKDCNVNKIVFSSTAAVYGEQTKMPIDEDALTNPTNPYGETKLAMEKMIKWFDEAYGIKYVTLRYFNVAGASFDSTLGELHNPETHLIPIILQVALNQREYLGVFGDDYDTNDGTCIRDYIHVEDLCMAHKLAVDYLFETNKSNYFNLGYGHGFSVMEMIEAARKVTSHAIPLKIEARRAGDPALLIASNDKAKKVLHWNPQYDDIELIINSAYQFYLKR